ncbi:hypothetical protein L6164_007683 [Bauhinia variegata]|uniref:Uncharacterized protein n=1 Tax=Bauhinia variegata TaxID=167791 RepID=A0ACB9PFG9_BAUVA|nr:hypothetical protein L6164_007683 [Bauhinia variegata]
MIRGSIANKCLYDYGFWIHDEEIYIILPRHCYCSLMLPADPRESETFRPLDMHHGMEVRLGLSKGPVCPSFI